MHRNRRIGLAIVMASAVLFGGCAARSQTSQVSSSIPAPTRPAPSGTATMAALGWRNGPADRVLLPSDTAIDRRVDQVNVITAVGRPASAAAVLTLLNETLPSYGWAITASGGGSLVFGDALYDGAFTSDDSVWALTIRVRK